MRIIVQFDAAVRPALLAWRRGLSASPLDAGLLADTFLDELKQRLVKSGGVPSGSVVDEQTIPPTFWCELTGHAWVGYTLTETGTYFRRERVIRILDWQPAPPPAATPSSPRN